MVSPSDVLCLRMIDWIFHQLYGTLAIWVKNLLALLLAQFLKLICQAYHLFPSFSYCHILSFSRWKRNTLLKPGHPTHCCSTYGLNVPGCTLARVHIPTKINIHKTVKVTLPLPKQSEVLDVPLRYLRSHFTASQCSFRRFVMYLLTIPTACANIRFGADHSIH